MPRDVNSRGFKNSRAPGHVIAEGIQSVGTLKTDEADSFVRVSNKRHESILELISNSVHGHPIALLQHTYTLRDVLYGSQIVLFCQRFEVHCKHFQVFVEESGMLRIGCNLRDDIIRQASDLRRSL